jgi:predicted TIM-barrel fold metal-dependent hydrolase
MFTSLATITAIKDIVATSPVPVVFDHFGGAQPEYTNCIPLAKMLIAANSDRIVWGTDWPHPDSVTPPGKKPTDVTPLFQIDDGKLLNQLPVWAPDAAVRKKILVDNPAKLYGFT